MKPRRKYRPKRTREDKLNTMRWRWVHVMRNSMAVNKEFTSTQGAGRIGHGWWCTGTSRHQDNYTTAIETTIRPGSFIRPWNAGMTTEWLKRTT